MGGRNCHSLTLRRAIDIIIPTTETKLASLLLVAILAQVYIPLGIGNGKDSLLVKE